MASDFQGQTAERPNLFARLVIKASERTARYRAYRTCVAELSNLDNRELRDLGISRGEIRHIALMEAYGNAA